MDVRQALVAAELNSIRHPWELARFRILHRLFAAHVTLRPGEPGWVLDVGCGDGFVSAALAAEYPALRFAGVDPELPDALQGTMAGGAVTLARSLDAIDCPEGAIRTIMILDVLEHIEDDSGALSAVLNDAKVAGDVTVIIFVPAFQALFYSHDRVLSHFRRYNRRTLGALVARCGLRAVESGYFFAAFLPIRMLEVALERMALVPPKGLEYSATWKRGAALANFIAAGLSAEFSVIRTLGRLGLIVPGLSVYAVSRRGGNE